MTVYLPPNLGPNHQYQRQRAGRLSPGRANLATQSKSLEKVVKAFIG